MNEQGPPEERGVKTLTVAQWRRLGLQLWLARAISLVGVGSAIAAWWYVRHGCGW